MLCNKGTKRNPTVLLTAAVVLASSFALTAWAKKGGGGKPGGGGESATYNQVDLGTLGGSNCSAYGLNDAGHVVGESTTGAEESHAFLLIPEYDDSDGDPIVWFRDGDGLDDEADGINDLMVNLGTLPGDLSSHAWSVNDSGQVVGTSRGRVDGKDRSRAFMWEDSNDNGVSDAGEMINLGALGGEFSEAKSINNLGQAVGWATGDGFAGSHAFLWEDLDGNGQSDAGEMIDLGTLGGASSGAVFINDSGPVLGRADTSATDNDGRFIGHAFLITPKYDTDGNPVLWFLDADGDGANDLMTDLGTFGGSHSAAVAMNDSGQIAGTAQISGSDTNRAFLLTPEYDKDDNPVVWFRDNDGDGVNDLMTDLGILQGTSDSSSADLNNSAQVVGHCSKNPGSRNSVLKRSLWENGRIKDLDGLTDSDVGMGAWISGINNTGQIVTSGGYILLPISAAP